MVLRSQIIWLLVLPSTLIPARALILNTRNFLSSDYGFRTELQYQYRETTLKQNDGDSNFVFDSSQPSQSLTRGRFLVNTVCTFLGTTILTMNGYSVGAEMENQEGEQKKEGEIEFISKGWGREEYTNSITASRDTNISPKEVYDSIQSSYLLYPLEQIKQSNRTKPPRVFDVGAGAGVSTQVLWNMGYRDIVAVDWSRTAWEENVMQVPPNVKFNEMDDETYVQKIWMPTDGKKFDAVVFNFAINESKARQYAKLLLDPDHGRLLAPVNTQSDYWLKQAFKVYDAEANVLWNASDVGAWSVQFQPDVTQDTCQGIWCAPFNGFKKPKL